MAIGSVLVVVVLVTIGHSLVDAQGFQEGCLVEHRVQRTVVGSSLLFMLAEPLDEELFVSMKGSSKGINMTLPLGAKISPLPEKWTEATLLLFPRLELRLAGKTVMRATRNFTFMKWRDLVMTHVHIMPNCPKGESVWRLIDNDKRLTFLLGEMEMFTFFVTEETQLVLHFDQRSLSVCMDDRGMPLIKENPDCTVDNDLQPGTPLHLVFKLGDGGYEIFGNDMRLMNQQWRISRDNKLVINVESNITDSVFVAHALPTSSNTASEPRRAMVSMALVALSAVLVVVIVLLVFVVVTFLLLVRRLRAGSYPAWLRGTREQASRKGNGEQKQPEDGDLSAIKSAEESPKLDTAPLPPTRPVNTISPEDDNEPEYITAKDVRPVAVEILKQKQVLQGNISHIPAYSQSGTPHESSSMHPTASRQDSSSTSYSVASRKQSSDTTYTNTYYDRGEYVYMAPENGVARMQQRQVPSDIYDNVHNSTESDYAYCDLDSLRN